MSAVTKPVGRALGLSRTPTPEGPSQEELDRVSAREKRAKDSKTKR
jgi:hypothetical protein